MKNKLIVLAMVLLMALTAAGCHSNDAPANSQGQTSAPVSAGSEAEPAQSADSSGEGSGATLVENEGDIEIVIPDDMDSDGF